METIKTENTITTQNGNSMTIEKFNHFKFLKIRYISDTLCMVTANQATKITNKKKLKFSNQIGNVIFDIAKCDTWSGYVKQSDLFEQCLQELHSKTIK